MAPSESRFRTPKGAGSGSKPWRSRGGLGFPARHLTKSGSEVGRGIGQLPADPAEDSLRRIFVRRGKRRAPHGSRSAAPQLPLRVEAKMVVMRAFLRMSLLAVVAMCAASSVAGQSAPPSPLRLVTATSSRPIPTVMNGDTELVAFDDLAAIFGSPCARTPSPTRSPSATKARRSSCRRTRRSPRSADGSSRCLHRPSRSADAGMSPSSSSGVRCRSCPMSLSSFARPRVWCCRAPPRTACRRPSRRGRQPGARHHRHHSRTPHQVQQEATRAIVRFDADLIDLTCRPLQSQGIVQRFTQARTRRPLVIDLGPKFGSCGPRMRRWIPTARA